VVKAPAKTGMVQEVEERQLRQLKVRRRGVAVRDIIKEECDRAGVKVAALIQGGAGGVR
jgi:hypothetical protein